MCCRARSFLFSSLLRTSWAGGFSLSLFFDASFPLESHRCGRWLRHAAPLPPRSSLHRPAVAVVAGRAQSRSLGQVVGQRARARADNDNSGVREAGGPQRVGQGLFTHTIAITSITCTPVPPCATLTPAHLHPLLMPQEGKK